MELKAVQTVYVKGIYDNHCLLTVVLDHSKEQVLLSVRERSLWIRSMRIFQFGKTFYGWPQTKPIFSAEPTPPSAPSARQIIDSHWIPSCTALPTPSLLKKNLLHRTGRIGDHSELTQNVNLSDIGHCTFEIGRPQFRSVTETMPPQFAQLWC